MPNVSDITLIGHLGRDAEIKQTKNGPVCEFSIAVTPWSKTDPITSWYRCSWFGDRAASMAPSLTKGKAVYVKGGLRPREFKGKNDELRTSLDVRVEGVEFVGGKGEQSAPAGAADDEGLPF